MNQLQKDLLIMYNDLPSGRDCPTDYYMKYYEPIHEALEKFTPKKPKHIFTEPVGKYTPDSIFGICCTIEISSDCKHCPECGQLLLWKIDHES